MMRLLRPPATRIARSQSDRGAACGLTRATHVSHRPSGIFLRSFPLHSAHYARETIAEICSMGVALATAPLSPTGS
jgi:hypothetical protein